MSPSAVLLPVTRREFYFWQSQTIGAEITQKLEAQLESADVQSGKGSCPRSHGTPASVRGEADSPSQCP